MKSSPAPFLTLSVLLAAAAVVLGGSVLLAKRETEDRRQVGRDELEEFSSVLARELQRLDALYEDHLERLARWIEKGSEISIRRSGEYLIGLRKISFVPQKGRGLHVEYAAGAPIPVARGNTDEVAIGGEMIEIDFTWEGWERDFYYQWRTDLNQYVVLAIDQNEVQAAIRGSIADWYAVEFEKAEATGVKAVIEGPIGAVLSPADLAESPDMVLPIKTRFGRWRVASWDEVNVLVSYDAPTLAVGSLLALLLAIAGGAAFFNQRKWQRLAEQRVSFVNRVSHELRTPLTNILLNADLAHDALELGGPEPERRLGLVREEAGRLARLIGNVLTFANSERGELELRPEPVRLAEMVDTALAPFRAALLRRGMTVELAVDSDASAMADSDACAQILTNLISNAEKYAAAGAWLGIKNGVDTNGVWLAVEDRGLGIAKGAEERIFGAFERLSDSVNEGSSGTGLGLAIARDLARQMGGELAFERIESGARFVLTLPVAPSNIVRLERRAAS
jgi:signal transduction histidine kinase